MSLPPWPQWTREEWAEKLGMPLPPKEPRTAGGPGSGNFGHAGRPGEVGGSASKGGVTASTGLVEISPGPEAEGVQTRLEEQARSALDHVRVLRNQLERDGVAVSISSEFPLDPTTNDGRRNINAMRNASFSMLGARKALREAGVTPPAIEMRLVEDDRSFYASAVEKTVRINRAHQAWQDYGTLRHYAQNNFESYWHPTKDPDDFLVHEMGHVLHPLSMSPKSFEPVNEDIARAVSRYAQHDVAEFVAETFTGLVRGKTYDEHVMKEYARLQGPPVKGRTAS